MAVVANSMHTRGKLRQVLVSTSGRNGGSDAYINRQIAPALFCVALCRIARRGPAEDSIISLMLPATNSRTTRKIVPVTVPIPTQAIMILGPSTDGFGISSIMWATPS